MATIPHAPPPCSTIFERSNGKLPSDCKREFGPLVREIRKSAHLYQHQVAKRMGVDRHHMSRIESGRFMLNLDTQTKLAHAMNMDLPTFIQKTWGKMLYLPAQPEH